MESMVKMGEVQVNITSDVKTTEELKVLLRWGWGAEITGKMAFNPSQDLKTGDIVKVIVEKVIDIPDPVEEAPEASADESQAETTASSEVKEEEAEKVMPVNKEADKKQLS